MMLSFVSRRCAYWIVCGLLLGIVQDAQARFYRWENEQGKVIYSDQVPPEDTKHKKEAINKSGRVTEVIEGAKSKEQWELEERLQTLRKEQEAIIAKQKSDDKVLTSTFRNLDDMRRALDGKMAALDLRIRVTEANLDRLQTQLQNQQKNAARYEREGKAVPQPVLNEIADTERQIALMRLDIDRQIQNKEQVKKDFEADMARFIFLTQSNETAERISDTTAELRAENELGLVSCDNAEQCNRVWQLARDFVKKFSNTPINVDNEQLIMSSDPANDQDISLSVSRMARPGRKTQIFLDIRCRKSSFGQELCAASNVKDIRTAFRPYIESGLRPQQ